MKEIQTKEIKNPIVRFLNYLTTYEKWYLFLALAISTVCAILFPEEDVNGVHGSIIMTLLLIYTWLNVTCELLISKQDKWNFIVSIFIELTEIAMYWILGYRFATMVTVIFFWLPIDIVSFIVWKKHPDRVEKQKTEVRQLNGWQRVAVIAGIVVWTVVIGTLIVKLTDGLAETTDIFDETERTKAIVVCYLDAMVSALDICNGTFILLRYREQWIAWYLEVIFDAVCVVLGGQYVLLVLTAAYLTNTTYGFVKWGRYIKAHEAAEKSGEDS
jgi:nicotinamide mononucleotide transporter